MQGVSTDNPVGRELLHSNLQRDEMPFAWACRSRQVRPQHVLICSHHCRCLTVWSSRNRLQVWSEDAQNSSRVSPRPGREGQALAFVPRPHRLTWHGFHASKGAVNLPCAHSTAFLGAVYTFGVSWLNTKRRGKAGCFAMPMAGLQRPGLEEGLCRCLKWLHAVTTCLPDRFIKPGKKRNRRKSDLKLRSSTRQTILDESNPEELQQSDLKQKFPDVELSGSHCLIGTDICCIFPRSTKCQTQLGKVLEESNVRSVASAFSPMLRDVGLCGGGVAAGSKLGRMGNLGNRAPAGWGMSPAPP
jgi:hypothetical protein